jgi:hypothetical protein
MPPYFFVDTFSYASDGPPASAISTAVPAPKRYWRYVLCDITGAPIADLEKHVIGRSVDFNLDQPTEIHGSIYSADPLANLTYTDGFPYLTEGDRLIYAFRRDYDGNADANPPWTIRAAGTVLNIEDNGDADTAISTFTAYDPWQYLYSLPVVNVLHPTDGTYDTTYVDTALGDIVVDLLTQAHATYTFANPAATGIDIFGGTVESLPEVTVTFQRETSIGEALEQCCALGCDIVLAPVYDPTLLPGVLANLNVYAAAGVERPDAVFGWNKSGRSLLQDNRQIDGTLRANNIRFHLQAEADSSEVTVTLQNAASVARFGDYFDTQYFPAATADMITGYANETFAERSEDKRVITLGPVPERSPQPFLDYYLGDSVKVEAGRQFRATQSGYQRVTGFTVEITDDALETVRDLRVYIPAED